MMKNALTVLLAVAGAAGSLECASQEVRQLADLTGANVGLVSTMLTNHQKGINAVAAKRIDLIASVERIAAEARLAVDREILVLNATGGGDIVKLLQALRDHADRAALAPAQLDAVQAQAKKDAASVYTPLSISTAKLDGSAKNLALLGKEPTDKEKAAFLLSYFKEVSQDAKQLKEQGDISQGKADAGANTKAAATQSAAVAMKETAGALTPTTASAK